MTRSNWSSLPGDEACAGSSQSPIDLSSSTATHATAANHARLFVTGHGVPTTSEFANNGHSAQLDVKHMDNFDFGFSYMGRIYSLVQLHSHWGRNNTMVSTLGFHLPQGSEHTIGLRHFHMEMHLVHQSVDNQTAVLAFFFEVRKLMYNKFMSPIMDALRRVRDGQRVSLGRAEIAAAHKQETFHLLKLIENSLKHGFFSYNGSLTTPPCTENVLWIIFREPIVFSEKQVAREKTAFFHSLC